MPLFVNTATVPVKITFDKAIEDTNPVLWVAVTKYVEPGAVIDLPDHLTKAIYPGRPPAVEHLAPQLKPYVAPAAPAADDTTTSKSKK